MVKQTHRIPGKLEPGTRHLLKIKKEFSKSNIQEKEVLLIIESESKKCYAIESVCPHSGGPLHLGDLVDIEDVDAKACAAVVCPYHQYVFNLATGACSDAPDLTAETWKVTLHNDSYFIELESGWVLCQGLETVDEENFGFDDRSKRKTLSSENLSTDCKSLLQFAVKILNTSKASEKALLTLKAADLFQNLCDFPIVFPEEDCKGLSKPPAIPPRDSDSVPFYEAPRSRKGGSLKNRITILHNLANVEMWAIDLCWDLIARFCFLSISDGISADDNLKCDFCTSHNHDETFENKLQLPREFFHDFVQMAAEEAKHHNLLVERLLDFDTTFGDLSCHGRLWDSATDTEHSILCRLAIVNMVHEARGLDVNPSTIAKFQAANDLESARRMQIIHEDEITHVARGQKWFKYLCEEWSLDPYKTFQSIVKAHFKGFLKPPFNEEDRTKAGIDPSYYLPVSQ